jgi:hypothetical protein
MVVGGIPMSRVSLHDDIYPDDDHPKHQYLVDVALRTSMVPTNNK